MCQAVKDYLGIIRSNKDIIITFAGLAAAIIVYSDFRDFVREQTDVSAKTAEILRSMQDEIHIIRAKIK
jgi:hypothetical protein